jgi:hypothetical protein
VVQLQQAGEQTHVSSRALLMALMLWLDGMMMMMMVVQLLLSRVTCRQSSHNSRLHHFGP